MGQTLELFGKGIEFTQSHLREAIPDSYDNCDPGTYILGVLFCYEGNKSHGHYELVKNIHTIIRTDFNNFETEYTSTNVKNK